jgi:hypothetical protein
MCRRFVSKNWQSKDKFFLNTSSFVENIATNLILARYLPNIVPNTSFCVLSPNDIPYTVVLMIKLNQPQQGSAI